MGSKLKRTRLCKPPTPMTIKGRSSTITNAFVNAVIPVIPPTPEEEIAALRALGMDASDIRCAYCGDPSTEWDHFHPLVKNSRPTGYITEIANLVPSCGKCNQSKGASDWRTWIVSDAKRSPHTRGVRDLRVRITRLERYEKRFPSRQLDIERLVGKPLWRQHMANYAKVLAALSESQELAPAIRGRLIVAVAGGKTGKQSS